MASAASPLFRLLDVTREKMRAISRSEGCGVGCFVSAWLCDKAVVPCLKYANQLFSHRFTGTRHLSIQLDTMSFTNPEKKGRCARHKTLEGAQSISKALAQNTPYSSPCECTPGTKKRGYSFGSQKKRCRLVIQRIRAPTQKKVMGGVQIRLRFYLGVAAVDD